MKVDAHQHFWQFSGNEIDYVWMAGGHEVLGRNYGANDLFPTMRKLGFDGTIAVQAREMPEETDYLLALVDAHPEIKGVVGWVDLCVVDVERALERVAGHNKLKGFRMLIHDRPEPDFAISDAHVNGVSKLEKLGLTYDLLLKPPHLPAAIQLVDRLPNQKFVVDHIAKPDIRNQAFEPWRGLMVEMALRPNVSCKLSSVITQAHWRDWKPAHIAPYLDIVLEAFGADRIMIGSDWPVSTCAADYEKTMGLLMQWSMRLSATEQAAFLGGNCARFYGVVV
jgi:L-fuconolactonase